MKEIRFYRSTGRYGFLSNLHPCNLKIEMMNVPNIGGTFDVSKGNTDVVEFDSVEHAYQWMKPNKREISEWIRQAPHPRLASIAGHGLLTYDVCKGWNKVKVQWMLSLLRIKFDLYHFELRKKLLETGDAVLIENSKMDSFWGIGKNGKGKNTLGRLLMLVREECR